MITRRLVFTVIAQAIAFPVAAAPASIAVTTRPVITMLGDSITAGLGIPARDALPARLQAALQASGRPTVVRGAGVSGDTTSGGLARLDFSVQSDTTLCIVELGGNDYLQSVDPRLVQSNLTQIVTQLHKRGIKVILLGGHAPAGGSGAYGRAFNAAFAAAGKAPGVVAVPDFLDTVLGHPGLLQPDGVHPNAAGVGVLVDRLAPVVKRALR